MSKKNCSIREFALGCMERFGDLSLTKRHGAYCVLGFDKQGQHVNTCRSTPTLARKVAAAAKAGKPIPTTGYYPLTSTSLHGPEPRHWYFTEMNEHGGIRDRFGPFDSKVEATTAQRRTGVLYPEKRLSQASSTLERYPANIPMWMKQSRAKKVPLAPWERGAPKAAQAELQARRFTAKLIDAGAVYNEPSSNHGNPRQKAGWHQDGVFLSKDPKEALRLLYGGG